MSFLGAINACATVKSEAIREVKLKPEHEVHAEDQILGKTPQEALSYFSAIFSLCPVSQTVAASLALNVSIQKSVLKLKLEYLFESLRYLVLELGSQPYREAALPGLARIRSLQRQLSEEVSPMQQQELLATLRQTGMQLLFLNLPLDWQDRLLFGKTFAEEASCGALFNRLQALFPLGITSVPLETRCVEEILRDLHPDVTSDSFSTFVNFPLTGAIARMHGNPFLRSFMQTQGNSALSRVLARFLETEFLLKHWETFAPDSAVIQTEAGFRISGIQNSRGLLIHVAKTDQSGFISHYRILTPTEINMTLSSSVREACLGLKGATESSLRNALELICLSFDPCTQIRTEIRYA